MQQRLIGPRKVSAIGLGGMPMSIEGRPWSPLGGIGRTAAVGAGRPALQAIAEDHGVSVQQVILAWELALAPTVIPIPGASRPTSIQDSVRAAGLDLTVEEIAKLSDADDHIPMIKEQT